jgi:hypothetical protein
MNLDYLHPEEALKEIIRCAISVCIFYFVVQEKHTEGAIPAVSEAIALILDSVKQIP